MKYKQKKNSKKEERQKAVNKCINRPDKFEKILPFVCFIEFFLHKIP